MKSITEKEIEILNYIDKEENKISQRKIANSLGISLGLVNLFLKKLVNKGLLKINKTKNKKILQYILTPQGFNERLNNNLYFLKKNIKYYSSAKQIILNKLSKLYKSDVRDIFIFGIDDWSEIIYLAAQNFDFNLCGFIAPDNKNIIETKFNYKVYTISQINKLSILNVLILATAENKNLIETNIEKLNPENNVNYAFVYF
jgi:DNA-binding MarR family transcriptional regulator